VATASNLDDSDTVVISPLSEVRSRGDSIHTLIHRGCGFVTTSFAIMSSCPPWRRSWSSQSRCCAGSSTTGF
jgi:hypothetical protein